MVQHALRKYGELVGTHPVKTMLSGFVFFLGLSIFFVSCLLGPTGVLTDVEAELLWSVRGGEMEKGVTRYLEEHTKDNPWEQTASLAVFVGKGKKRGADIFTVEALDEIVPLYQKWYNITVTTASGKEFGTYDLCSRGVMPDTPGSKAACDAWEASNRTDVAMQGACFPSPMMPCFVSSPLQCFREEAAVLHPSYKALDPIIGLIIPGALPYTTRPSYRELGDVGMKQESSTVRPDGKRGCSWWTTAATFEPQTWAGELEMTGPNNSLVDTAGGLMWTLLYDGPARIRFRMSLTKPGHVESNEIEEAIEKHQRAWEAELLAFSETMTLVEAATIGPTAAKDATKENESPAFIAMFLGGAIMHVYAFFALVSYRYPMTSRVDLGFKGIAVVGTVISAAAGFYLLCGWKLNTSMIAALPFMAMGLGVNDMFVIVRYFSELGIDYITDQDESTILGELLAQAGPGTTVTSLCNFAAFGCGVLLPIPAMADFCLGAAVIAIMNYVAMLTMFLPLVVFEARRIKQRQPEQVIFTYFCHRRLLKQHEQQQTRDDKEIFATSAMGHTSSLEKRFVLWLTKSFAPALFKPIVKIGLSLIAVASITGSIFCIGSKTIGYKVESLVPPELPAHRALELLMGTFTYFPSKLCFYELDVPVHQREMIELYDQVTSLDLVDPWPIPNFVTMFGLTYILPLGAIPVVGSNDSLTLADVDMSLKFDGAWTHPILAPFGLATNDASLFYPKLHAWSHIPFEDPLSAWFPGANSFLYADLSAVNEFTFSNKTGLNELKFSFFPFALVNLKTDGAYIDAISQVNKIIEDSPLKGKAFAYGDIFTYWQVFLELEPELIKIFCIDMVVIFVINLLLLRSAVAAITSTVACMAIVIEIYGLAMTFLMFNVFVAATLLMAMGITIEFTAHLAAAFAFGHGAPSERLGHAMAHTFPALIEGSISTLCGILPMAWHATPFIVDYFFKLLLLVVIVGIVNGLVFMPVILAVLSPLTDLIGGKGADGVAREASTDTTVVQGAQTILAASSTVAGKDVSV